MWRVKDALFVESEIDQWFRNLIGIVPNRNLRTEVLSGVKVRVYVDEVDWGQHGNVIVCANNVAFCLETFQTVSVQKNWYLREDNVLAAE